METQRGGHTFTVVVILTWPRQILGHRLTGFWLDTEHQQAQTFVSVLAASRWWAGPLPPVEWAQWSAA